MDSPPRLSRRSVSVLLCVILQDGWSVEVESVIMGPIVTPEENGQMAELKKRRLTHLDNKK